MDADIAHDLRAARRVPLKPRIETLNNASAMRTRRVPLLRRLFPRKEVTTFHRCLAVHMHFAERRGVLR